MPSTPDPATRERRFLLALLAGGAAVALSIARSLVVASVGVTAETIWLVVAGSAVVHTFSLCAGMAAGYTGATAGALTDSLGDTVATFAVAGLLAFGVGAVVIPPLTDGGAIGIETVGAVSVVSRTASFVVAGIAGTGLGLARGGSFSAPAGD